VQGGYGEYNWGNWVNSLRESVKKRDSRKGAVIQRGLEPGSRGLVIVKAVTRQLLVNILGAGKICKV
jgi:hypothetical protein